MSKSARVMPLLMFLLSLQGCSFGPAEQSAPHTYLLNPNIAVKRLPANPARTAPPTLLVSAPRAQAGFDTPRMAYLLRPHEVSYYAVNHWVDTPSRMLLRLLAESMESTGLWRAVVQAPSTIRTEYRLDCDNLVLEQQFFWTPSRVRLALRAQMIDMNRQDVMSAHDFEVFEDAPSDDAYGGVVAANRAVAKLLGELAAWTGASIDESTRAKR